MDTTIKTTLLATAVALTVGTASANIFNTPAFPTLDTHTASSVEYFDIATGSNGEQVAITLDSEFNLVFDYGDAAEFLTNGYTVTEADVAINGRFEDKFDAGDKFGASIESSNEWYKQGSGSADLGGGVSFTLGYGQTDVSLVGHFTDSTTGPSNEDSSGSMELFSDQVTNVTVGVNKVVWSDSDEAIVVGANYGTESNLSVGTSYQKNIMVGEGMIQAGVSAGHNVDSGITGFGYMAGYDAGVQAEGFDGLYGGFSVTDGLMTVGIVDVDTDGTRHNLTLNPIGIIINLFMGNDTVFNHNFNK